MKRFAFRLERLRELRERAERERAALLGHAMREEDERRETLAQARGEVDRMGTQAAALPGGGPVSAGLLQSVDRARGVAEERVDAAVESLQAANERMETERGRYGDARRDLRVVEKLKERRFDAWRELGAREERKESDEVAHHRRITKEERS